MQDAAIRGCRPADPVSLKELLLTLPPMFAEACGYRGKARYVALCWIPELGELWWSDDGEAVLGTASSFLTLCRHPATAGALSEYRFAAAQDSIRPWLLVDRGRRTLSSGPPDRVWRVIEGQAEDVGRAPAHRGPAATTRARANGGRLARLDGAAEGPRIAKGDAASWGRAATPFADWR
jgi:hypothetical protein